MSLENPKTEKPQLIPLTLTSSTSGKQYDVTSETLIGREVECTVSLDSPHVSRYHAKIIVTPSGAVIEDLNSSNGTFVNGKRIKEKTAINVGDEIRFDDLTFRLTSKDSGKSDATVLVSRQTIPANEDSAPVSSTEPEEHVEAKKEAPQEQELQKPSPSSKPAEVNKDGDNTRMLSSDQLNQAVSINKQAKTIADKGTGPRLIATTAPIRGKVFPLPDIFEGAEWKLGRSRDCEVSVSDPSVSRHHATLKKLDGRFHISASESSKALIINEKSIEQAVLKHNDNIQVGHMELVFRLDDNNPTQSAFALKEPVDNSRKYYPYIAAALVGAGLLLVGMALLTQ